MLLGHVTWVLIVFCNSQVCEFLYVESNFINEVGYTMTMHLDRRLQLHATGYVRLPYGDQHRRENLQEKNGRNP